MFGGNLGTRSLVAAALCVALTSGSSHAVTCGSGCWQDPSSGSGILTTKITWNTVANPTAQVGTYTYGNGNFNPATFSLPSGYSLIDTNSPSGADATTKYNIGISPNFGATSGTWSITTSGSPPTTYSNFLLVFNRGNLSDSNPDWIAFKLGNLLSGGWAELGSSEDLIKAYLYGGPSLFAEAPVVGHTPLPAAAFLFLSGLAGLGLLGRRRKLAHNA